MDADRNDFIVSLTRESHGGWSGELKTAGLLVMTQVTAPDRVGVLTALTDYLIEVTEALEEGWHE